MKAKILVFAKVFTPPAPLVKGGSKNTTCISSRDAPVVIALMLLPYIWLWAGIIPIGFMFDTYSLLLPP